MLCLQPLFDDGCALLYKHLSSGHLPPPLSKISAYRGPELLVSLAVVSPLQISLVSRLVGIYGVFEELDRLAEGPQGLDCLEKAMRKR